MFSELFQCFLNVESVCCGFWFATALDFCCDRFGLLECLFCFPACCLPACLPACLCACVPVCLRACVPACVRACVLACLLAGVSFCFVRRLPALWSAIFVTFEATWL